MPTGIGALRAASLAALLAASARADVLVTTLDRTEPLRGISLTLDERSAVLHSAQGAETRIDTERIIEITTVPPPPPSPAATRPFEAELTCGSRIRGKLLAPDAGESLRLASPILTEAAEDLDIPFDALRAVVRVEDAQVTGSSRIVRVPGSDSAYYLTGSRVEGILARFAPTGVEIARDGQRVTLPYDQLAAVFVTEDPLPAPAGLHAMARLVDGSMLVLARGFRVMGGQLRGETPSGIAVRLNMSRLESLGFQGGAFLHLSDLPPKETKREPFFPVPDGPAKEAVLDFVCPVRLDRSPDDRPITLRGQRYYKGIGVRPTTEITWELPRPCSVFEAVAGIDDEVLGTGYGRGAGTGSVVFVVKVDGKEAWRSKRVEGGQPPVSVRVPLDGAKTLTLAVILVPAEMMPKGIPDSPELDNAVWARPLLIR